MKTYLTQLPKIASPLEGEILALYLEVSEHVVSTVLVVEQAKGADPYVLRKPRLGKGGSELPSY